MKVFLVFFILCLTPVAGSAQDSKLETSRMVLEGFGYIFPDYQKSFDMTNKSGWSPQQLEKAKSGLKMQKAQSAVFLKTFSENMSGKNLNYLKQVVKSSVGKEFLQAYKKAKKAKNELVIDFLKKNKHHRK